MYLTLLGLVQVHWEEGGPPRFRSQRTMALLGYLVAEARPFARDYLSALLWPDEDSAKGKANLRRELHNLAQILPGCWQTSRLEVAFVPSAETVVDIVQFQQHEAAGQWQAAADLIGGNFLEGMVPTDNLEFETWLLGEQERWRQRSVTVLRRQIDTHSQQRQYAEALAYTFQLLKISPWDEETHQQAMLLLAKTGQYKAAMKQFETCRQLLDEELAVEPSAKTLALVQRIQAAEASRGPNLPAQTTAFVGRETDLNALGTYLANPDCRLVTLVGPGGIGKTRLAIAGAEQLHQHFLEGAYFIPLLSVTSVETVVSTIAEAFNLNFREERPPREQLLDHLRSKEALLVLDNLEQLLGEKGEIDEEQSIVRLIEEILTASAEIKIIATSREVLNSFSEQIYPVAGLPVSSDTMATNMASLPAVELFRLRAQQAKGDSADFDMPELKAVAEICRLVEGMPLAIELAAAQVRLYSPADIAASLRQNLDILQINTRGLNQRHQSMRAVFDVSWQSLELAEQHILAQLSIFSGGFTRQAAAAIVQAKTHHLSVLLHKSLILGGPGRFDLHTLLKQFAAEMLAGMPEQRERVQRHHFDYYRHLLSQAVSAWGDTSDPAQLDILRPEVENLHTAWNWINVQDDRREDIIYLEDLWQFFYARHRYSEAIRYLSLALERIPDDEVDTQYSLLLAREDAYNKQGERKAQKGDLKRLEAVASRLGSIAQATVALRQAEYAEVIGEYDQAMAQAQKAINYGQRVGDNTILAEGHYVWGKVLQRQGQYAAAKEQFLAGLELAQEAENQKQTANCFHGLGDTAHAQSDYLGAITYHEQALAIRDEIGDRHGKAKSLCSLGSVASSQGDIERANSYLDRSLARYREISDRLGEGQTLANLGYAAYSKGDYVSATAYLKQALVISREIGDRAGEAAVLGNLGLVASQKGRYAQATAYVQQALSIACEIEDRSDQVQALINLGLVADSQGDYLAATDYHKQALIIAREIGDRYDEAAILLNLGLVSWKKGDYSRAEAHYEQSIHIIHEIGFRRGESFVLTNFGHLAQDRGDYTEAKILYEQALTIARQIDALSQEGKCLNELGWVAMAQKLPALAATHFRQAQTIRQELHQPQLLVEDWVGLAQVQLAVDNKKGAGQNSQQIIAYLKENPGLHGAENPIRTFHQIWKVLLALERKGDAHEVLSLAIQRMKTYLNKVSDSAVKEIYLSRPHHQVLWQAWNERYPEPQN